MKHPNPWRDAIYLAGTAVLALLGCAEDLDPVDTRPAGMATSATMDGIDNGPMVSSTYEALQDKIFEAQGCTVQACHDADTPAGRLDLTAGVSYEQLLEVPSANFDLVRVAPGDDAQSYLFRKLVAASDSDAFEIEASPMPLGARPIPAPLLEALRLWILAGAPREGTVEGTAELLELE